jgi:outer membrane biosynthesis protein TonB
MNEEQAWEILAPAGFLSIAKTIYHPAAKRPIADEDAAIVWLCDHEGYAFTTSKTVVRQLDEAVRVPIPDLNQGEAPMPDQIPPAPAPTPTPTPREPPKPTDNPKPR